MRLSSRLALSIAVALGAASARAQEPVGPAFQLNSYVAGSQFGPSAAAGPDGSFFVVWTSDGQDGDARGVYGRRFTASGAPLGPEFRVNEVTAGSQIAGRVASNPNGGFVVVWTSYGGQDGDEAGVYGRRFSGSGAPLGPEFQVNRNTVSNQLEPNVAVDGVGNLVVVWASLDEDPQHGYDIVGRRFDSNGKPLGPEFAINSTLESSRGFPVACSYPTGQFVVAWTTEMQAGDFYGIWVRRFSASGTPLGPEIHVTAESQLDAFQVQPSIACLASGGFFLVWQGDADQPDVFGRMYDASGAPEGPEFRINTYTTDFQLEPNMVAVRNGYVVFWHTQKLFNTIEGIFGQRLDQSGQIVGEEFRVDTTPSPDHSVPIAAADADGNLLAAWETGGARDGDLQGVFGRLYQLAYDFGDAPDPYPTLRAQDGARHVQPGLLEPSPLHLGLSVEPESEPLPEAPDDDGVTFATPLKVGETSGVAIDSSAPGLLDGWFDFNQDGDWNDAGEQVFVNRPLAAGANSLNVTVPSATQPGATVARFRISSEGGLSPTGLAADGEVEDHWVEIAPASVSVADGRVVEGAGGTRYARFEASLSAALPLTTRVDYATEGGSAIAPSDYVHSAGTLVFPPGVTRRSVNVPVVGDGAIEEDEYFFLRLSNPRNAVLSNSDALGTIENDDHAGTFQFSGPTYSVGESAPSVTITVKRTGGLAGGAGVAYVASDGSATAGADYLPVSGVLTFEAGVASRTFTVRPLSDTLPEGPEAVLLHLHDPVGQGAALGLPNTAVLTILDNDRRQALGFKSAARTVSEGATVASITVARTFGSSGTVTVDYAASNGTASQPSDYGPVSGTLTFGPGVITRSFEVPIVDDAAAEGQETVSLSLTNAVGADLGPTAASTLTILDNDVPQEVQFNPVAYSANEAGPWATITVRRSGGTSGTATVSYTTADGTAQQPADFSAVSGTLTFGPGVAVRSFRVPLVNDDEIEGSETLVLRLGSPTGAVLGPAAEAGLTILDSEPTFRFRAAKYRVGESGAAVGVTVVRTGSSALPASVSYATADGTATAGSDYVATSGRLTFPAGVATRTFTVSTFADAVDEPNETIALLLSDPAGAGLGTPLSALVTVVDNDVAGTVRFDAASYSVIEGDGVAMVTVTRTGGLSAGATINYATSDGSATAGEDYTVSSGTLTFGAGETTKSLAVPIGQDVDAEGNETVNLTLSNPGGGLLLGSPSTAVLWIIDP